MHKLKAVFNHYKNAIKLKSPYTSREKGKYEHNITAVGFTL